MATSEISGSPKFRKHILICINERPEGHPKGSCARCQGMALRQRFVQQIQNHGLKGQVRASKTYCLDACELGPVVVVYPDDLWYVRVQPEDVAAIFEASVLGDEAYEPRLATAETWQELKAIRAQTVKNPPQA